MKLETLPEKPLVSILVANYNYEAYIREALQSALSQTYGHLEIVVCDDGSTDGSCSIVETLASKDARIKLLRQENRGVGAALNTAYEACSGEIVCLLDADDVFDAGKVQQVVEKMKTVQRAGFVQHAMQVIDERGKKIGALPAHGRYEEGWIAERLAARGGRWRNMPASALCFRREVADLLFPMPSAELRSMADAFLYMLAPLLTVVGYIPQPLSSYRLHGANLTGAAHFDARVSERYTEGIPRVHRCLARVITDRKLDIPAFETTRHLTYLEHEYMSRLFTGEKFGRLWRNYRTLAGHIRADDLYPPVRKMLGLLVLGSALFVPGSWRSAWITRWMSGWRR